ncbi:tyrosine--tRNA ligase [Candidatus Woesearchaeota archaeon]|nr:tyrosine--tRNA ligase [Candidatus Woesearchaeota archaeon]
MVSEKKYHLIVRDLQEVVDEDKIKEILSERDLNVYWGTAPTGVPHFGYFVPMFKIADFLEAGCHVTILFANIHAYLDNMKTDWELLAKRTKFYEFLIREMLSLIGVPLDKLKFVKGTDFQLQEKYTLDMYKLSALASTRGAQKAGADVVKQSDTPKMSGLLYPILQALDEQYLEVDAQFGGVDQRKIFMFAREFLPKIGYEKRIHLMNYLVPGLGESGKMSSSEPNSKIDFDDSDKIIRSKINKAFSVDGNPEGNGLLAMLKFVIFKQLEREGRNFVIDRPEQYGGRVEFESYDSVEAAFASKELSSIDLKQGLSSEIISFISPLREKLEENRVLLDDAYPDLK